MKLYELLIKSTDALLKKHDKEVLAGHDGPYGYPETNIRNTAHLTMLCLKCYQITKKTKYKKASIELLDYILKNGRPYGQTYYHRDKGKDNCNGLIGQAWTIEALIEAYKIFNEKKYLKRAREIFLLHEFNDKLGFWRKRDIDGKKLFFDMTFNHQLWFAAIGSLISTNENDEIGYQTNKFMNKLEKNTKLHKNGLIKHFILANFVRPIGCYIKTPKKLYNQEVGYYAFNLYALGILKEQFPKHKFWQSKKMKKIAKYSLSKEHIIISEKSKYGFPYNPSGIEQAYFTNQFKEFFKNHKIIMKERLEKQFENHLNKKTNLMNRNTSDVNTFETRIYEAVRIPDMDLKL